jgi:hypothetical protein
MVPKTGGKTLNDRGALLYLAQQQPPRTGRDRPAVKPPYNLALIQRMKFEGLLVTLCL